MLSKNTIILISLTIVSVLFFYLYEKQNPVKEKETPAEVVEEQPSQDVEGEQEQQTFDNTRSSLPPEDSTRLFPVFKTLDSLASRVNKNQNDRVAYERFNFLYDSLMANDSLMAKINKNVGQ